RPERDGDAAGPAHGARPARALLRGDLARDRGVDPAGGGGRLPAVHLLRRRGELEHHPVLDRPAHAEPAVQRPDPGGVLRQHLARHGVLDARVLRGAQLRARGRLRIGGAGRRRPGAPLPVDHAAAAAPRDRHQPDAHHAADPVGLRPDLHHDRRRARPAEPDPAPVHVRAGLLLRPARLRHGRGAAAAPDRGRGLAGVPAPAAGGGEAMTTTTRTLPTTSSTGGRARSTAVASTVAMLVIGLAFLVPLLWVVLASFDTEASLSVAWPSNWS